MGWLSEFYTLFYVSHIGTNSFAQFQLGASNSEKDKYLKKRKKQFEIVQHNIREDKNLRGSSQSQKSHNEILLFKILGERALVNNFLEYLCAAKIAMFLFHFRKLKMNKKNI